MSALYEAATEQRSAAPDVVIEQLMHRSVKHRLDQWLGLLEEFNGSRKTCLLSLSLNLLSPILPSAPAVNN